MKIVIPKKTNVAGFEITVELSETLGPIEKKLGRCDFRHNKIILADPATDPFHRDIHEQTYLHEGIHFVLHCMGENVLSKNEKFIEGFSHLLYEFLTKTEGEEYVVTKIDEEGLSSPEPGSVTLVDKL